MDSKYLFYVVMVGTFLFLGLIFFSSQKLEDMPIDETIPVSNLSTPQNISGEAQEVSIRALKTGRYDKSIIEVKAGVPIKLSFTADPGAGCGRQLLIDNVGINLISRNGETVVAYFTFPQPGRYNFHCAMNMFRGTFIAN
ncbi:MAG: cupredoxin domain-containing protein [Candidatus Micrarchaeota archaeon]|nr:cupredoxin domain-containing protein [Candidatus Micrarchaeota archaeon]